MRPEQIIIEPIVTEKSTLAKGENKYVFKVHPKATKIDIKRAIEQIFKVKAVAVNTSNVSGKRRALGRFVGKTARWKKAYVSLFPGEKIEKLEA